MLLAGAALLASCKEKEEVTYYMTADKTAISDVAANNPSDETLVLKTNATSWLVLTPDWVTATPNSGEGKEDGTVITLKIASNYKNESTDTSPRSGVLKFSGSGQTLEIPISQNGHTAVVDPNASIGGIPDMAEFEDFVKAVNNGDALTRWLNSDGEVELQTNIDLSEYSEWTPIGAATKSGNGNTASKPEGPCFEGKFNGAGHTITFKSSALIPDGGTWGLFGVTKGAVIKDLKIVADVTVEGEAVADAGILVGTAYGTTIENVSVSGSLNIKGNRTNDKRFAIGGIAGFVFSATVDEALLESNITNCEANLNVTGDSGANVKNGGTGVQFGGIAGFSTSDKTDARNHIENCTFGGAMNVASGRAAGIGGAANWGTIYKNCVNNASMHNEFTNGREAGVVCVIAEQCAIIDCVNNGNLTTIDTSTTLGGIFALLNHDTCYVEGGANYGDIICANEKYRGLIGANWSKFDHVTKVGVGGRLGDDANNLTAASATNFMELIGFVVEGKETLISDLYFASK